MSAKNRDDESREEHDEKPRIQNRQYLNWLHLTLILLLCSIVLPLSIGLIVNITRAKK